MHKPRSRSTWPAGKTSKPKSLLVLSASHVMHQDTRFLKAYDLFGPLLHRSLGNVRLRLRNTTRLMHYKKFTARSQTTEQLQCWTSWCSTLASMTIVLRPQIFKEETRLTTNVDFKQVLVLAQWINSVRRFKGDYMKMFVKEYIHG